MSSSKNIVRQEQILHFLASTMTIVENRNFTVRRVDLCSGLSYLFPNEIVTGYMFIIGEDSYFREVDMKLARDRNHTAIEYSSLVSAETEALFLKYGYQKTLSDDYAYKFKKLATVDSVNGTGFDSNIGRFAYLADALILLDETVLMDKPSNKTTEVVGKTIVKKLNTI